MAAHGRRVFGDNTFLVITGASKGLGRSIAINFAKKLGTGSFILLLARNIDGLKGTAEEIFQFKTRSELNVSTVQMDLSTCEEKVFDELLGSVLESNGSKAHSFKRAMVIHCAASLGDVTRKACSFSDEEELQNYWKLNITSPAILSSVFLRYFPPKTVQVWCLNITSICSIQPLKTWSLYCTGKAARDMWFKVLAAEEPDVRVISYSPGPLDTDMMMLARTMTGDEELRDTYVDMNEKGDLLNVDTSARKLIRILENDRYQSGEHVDYFDIRDDPEDSRN